jgi:transcription initiation factor TFIIIB Brf1 subunit/transcription initiation factor TFIIB
VATLSKNKHGMWQHLNSKKQQEQIDWRRAKVLELMSKGETNQSEMAKTLQVDRSVISKDVAILREHSRENLQRHIQDKLPEEYQHCLTGMNQVLKLSWDIANKSKSSSNDSGETVTVTDDRTRLQALSLINDCYKYIMDLTTNGIVITDAIKFVQTTKEKLTMSSKEDNNGSKESKKPDNDNDEDKNQLEEKLEDEKTREQRTTNHIF